jgi:hypothetical protein
METLYRGIDPFKFIFQHWLPQLMGFEMRKMSIGYADWG